MRLTRRLRPNTFQADDASSVVLLARSRIRYKEAGRSLLIAQDLQNDPRLVAIERASMRAWEPPDEAEPLSDRDKDAIVDNMRRAFAARGYGLMLLDEYYQGSGAGSGHATVEDSPDRHERRGP